MKKYFLTLVFFFLFFFIYKAWFLPGTLAGGDWPYLFKETIQNFSFSPDPKNLWLGPYYQITSKLFVQYLNIPWELTEKIFWFWMFLILSFFSSLFLSKAILGKSKINFLTTLIFMTNTYILMIVGGGQMGIALCYALSPAVFGYFIKFLKTLLKKDLVWGGVCYAFAFMFDPRITYVLSIALAIYFLYQLIISKRKLKLLGKVSAYLLLTAIITLVINSSWIIPIILSKKNVFNNVSLGTTDSLNYFSFGSFSFAFSFLHPNWPDNIFGKTFFLKPEFLILPLLAFASLFFIKKSEKLKDKILPFSLIGLVGVFLSKGVHEPFGQIYSWMFSFVPGFNLFRDPTKFYILIILSFSILIPFALEKICEEFKEKFNIKLETLIITVFIFFWVFLIRQAILGNLSGTFMSHQVPQDYISLKNFLIKDSSYSATLWIPAKSPFSFYSSSHPALEMKTIPLLDNKIKEYLKKNKIKYIIIPEDTTGDIFVSDRKFDEKIYEKTILNLEKTPYLIHAEDFGKIVVFQVRQ